MRYYLDTEFNEDGKTIDLISIALVREDGKEFYAVSEDAELHRVQPWVRQNVLPQLPLYGDLAWMGRGDIRTRLESFLFDDPAPRFWAWYAAYDWVAFCRLFGRMIDLPPRFPKFCFDLKQLHVQRGAPALPPQMGTQHNALDDARWNRDVHLFLDPTLDKYR